MRNVEEILLDQVLEFIVEAPEEEFVLYLIDCGEDAAGLATEARTAIFRAVRRHAAEPGVLLGIPKQR